MLSSKTGTRYGGKLLRVYTFFISKSFQISFIWHVFFVREQLPRSAATPPKDLLTITASSHLQISFYFCAFASFISKLPSLLLFTISFTSPI